MLIAVAAAAVITVIGLRLYLLDDVSRLDASLPGREKIRSSLPGADESDKQFGPTGPVDQRALSDFQALYTKKRTALDALGRFDDTVLELDSLRITTNE